MLKFKNPRHKDLRQCLWRKEFWRKKSKFLVLVLSFAFCIFHFAFWSNSYAADKIAAIVNNDVITQKDLGDFINFTRMQLSREYAGSALEEKIQSIQKDLLDKLIEDRLLLQEAKKNKVIAQEARIKARINEIKMRYDSDGAFQADLSRQGLVQADIEARIREQILIYGIIELKVREGILVRPDEVTDFYNKNSKEFLSREERELEAITLENEDLAKSFAFNLRSGQNLTDLAARYPITINRIKVSDEEELREDIRGAVFKLGPGEVSDPLKIGAKYYVFKLDNIIPPRQQPLSEAQDTIQAILLEKKMQEGLDKWLGELRKQSYIKIMQ